MPSGKILRSHTCGELTAALAEKTVTLCGWVHTHRDHGGVIFIDLRDRHGLTQVVFDPSGSADVYQQAEHVRREWVIRVEGKVRARAAGMENPKIKTGAIELVGEKLEVLNESESPPFKLDEWGDPTEALRLKFRYLDLRRPEMQRHLQVRHVAAQTTRQFLSEEGFLEIETPMLVRSTPEGARDFLVPSRTNPGAFYSLPQSPQLYKQLLMVSGVDRYFQIARCMRDEDLRQDRQPEFTQIDIEASFITEEFIYDLVERMMKRIFHASIGADLPIPFRRLTYAESMEKYGSDKPDLRYDLPLVDVSAEVAASEFAVFKEIVQRKGIVKCLCPRADFSRKDFDDIIAFAQRNGAKGLAWMKVTEKGLDSNIVKYFPPAVQEALLKKTGARPGAALLFVADLPQIVHQVLSRLRSHLAEKLSLIPAGKFEMAWITDFPLFEYDEKEKKIGAAHHIFTSPKPEHLDLLETDPLKVLARCYDLVLNGVEICSGSIRIHNPEVQKRVMKVIGLSEAEAERRFGFLLEAFKYGAPPHGGIAPGFDRLVALLCGYNDIREVIAFPKTASGASLLDGSPSPVDERQLKELHLKTLP